MVYKCIKDILSVLKKTMEQYQYSGSNWSLWKKFVFMKKYFLTCLGKSAELSVKKEFSKIPFSLMKTLKSF